MIEAIQLPKAQLEILEAWEWYENKQDGLGDRFIKEVRRKIKYVQNNPLHYPLKGNYREAQTDISPYLIIFKFDNAKNIIFVVSVFHMTRHPNKKY